MQLPEIFGGTALVLCIADIRNDALANVAMIATGIVTAYTRSGWPDLVVGLGIAALNADAAREVWSAARREHRTANA